MLSASTVWRRSCCNWWLVILISRQRLWIPPRLCHVFAVPLYTWRIWAHGALRMAPVDLLGTLSTRAIQMPVILLVCCERPFGSRLLTSRTAFLHRCGPEIVLYIFRTGLGQSADWHCVRTVYMLPAASDSRLVIPVCDSAPVSSDSRYLVIAGFWWQPVSRQPVCDSGLWFCPGF